jgi:osmoprotectant transport system permease protein
MVPIFQQTGPFPAIVGLFLYSILPILRNTLTALSSVDRRLIEVGQGLGLKSSEVLKLIEIPLAAPVILAGVRTAAVISVGTATFAAFIGAGGLGESIVQGLSLNDNTLMLQGVIPASLLAISIEVLFEVSEKYWFGGRSKQA